MQNFRCECFEDQNLRQGIKDFSDWPTIPQLYIKGEFIEVVILLRKCWKRENLKKF